MHSLQRRLSLPQQTPLSPLNHATKPAASPKIRDPLPFQFPPPLFPISVTCSSNIRDRTVQNP